jgi:hypothetical protein
MRFWACVVPGMCMQSMAPDRQDTFTGLQPRNLATFCRLRRLRRVPQCQAYPNSALNVTLSAAFKGQREIGRLRIARITLRQRAADIDDVSISLGRGQQVHQVSVV